VAGITQAIYPVAKHLKTDLLDEVIRRTSMGGVIVFTRTKHGADRLTRQLEKRGHGVVALHGNRTQSQRERALSDLRRGRIDVLVATDIASRGIDVNDITHVINFDVPHTPEDYVHRIGRTGRVDALGDAFTFMSPDESKDVTGIERFLGKTIPRVLMPDFDYKAKPEPSASGGGGRPEGRVRGGRHGGREERGGRRGSSQGVVSVVRHGSGPAPSQPARAAEPTHGRRPKSADSTRRGRRRI